MARRGLQAGDGRVGVMESRSRKPQLTRLRPVLGIVDDDVFPAREAQPDIEGARLGPWLSVRADEDVEGSIEVERRSRGLGLAVVGLDQQLDIQLRGRIVDRSQIGDDLGQHARFAVERHQDRVDRQVAIMKRGRGGLSPPPDASTAASRRQMATRRKIPHVASTAAAVPDRFEARQIADHGDRDQGQAELRQARSIAVAGIMIRISQPVRGEFRNTPPTAAQHAGREARRRRDGEAGKRSAAAPGQKRCKPLAFRRDQPAPGRAIGEPHQADAHGLGRGARVGFEGRHHEGHTHMRGQGSIEGLARDAAFRHEHTVRGRADRPGALDRRHQNARIDARLQQENKVLECEHVPHRGVLHWSFALRCVVFKLWLTQKNPSIDFPLRTRRC